jgi:hypothetical protein
MDHAMTIRHEIEMGRGERMGNCAMNSAKGRSAVGEVAKLAYWGWEENEKKGRKDKIRNKAQTKWKWQGKSLCHIFMGFYGKMKWGPRNEKE